MARVPIDLRTAPLPPFAPAARRLLRAFGAPVELVLLPERAARSGRPGRARPAFQPSAAERILAEEALWRDDALAVTPNRFPFAAQQAILWAAAPTREHDRDFLARLFGWGDELGGTVLVNGIGAAASIPRAHAHATVERLPFLAALPERALSAPFLPTVDGVTYVVKDVPFCLLGARGPAPARAAAVAALQNCRMTAAVNLVAQDGTTWLFPRSLEIPAPWFPAAVGSAEVWGRWCHVDEASFAAASGDDVERALAVAGMPRL